MSDYDTGKRYDSTKQAWEDIWQGASMQVELEAVQYRRAQRSIAAYLPYLNKEDVILEAGSGLSAVVIALREKGYNVMGMDYAVNALHISQQYDKSLPLYAGDIHQLPHPDNSIDAYLSFGVLEHFEHGMQPALREAYRILKPGGVLVMTIPYPNLVWQLAQWRRNRSGQGLIDDEFYESTYNYQQLRDNVTQAGFAIEALKPTSHAFTLWGLGSIFQAKGYYRTSWLAETAGDVLRVVAPRAFNFMTMTIARK
ncbi:MAG: class I SAM-dependent methyltransferase [Aggregatilineales bacterium]